MRSALLSAVFCAAKLVTSRTIIGATEVEPKPEATYFNSQKVPPLLELTPDNFEDELKKSKFLLIKHYRSVVCVCWEANR